MASWDRTSTDFLEYTRFHRIVRGRRHNGSTRSSSASQREPFPALNRNHDPAYAGPCWPLSWRVQDALRSRQPFSGIPARSHQAMLPHWPDSSARSASRLLALKIQRPPGKSDSCTQHKSRSELATETHPSTQPVSCSPHRRADPRAMPAPAPRRTRHKVHPCPANPSQKPHRPDTQGPAEDDSGRTFPWESRRADDLSLGNQPSQLGYGYLGKKWTRGYALAPAAQKLEASLFWAA
jgi:hypothetical protein